MAPKEIKLKYEKLKYYLILMRLNRPIGIFLLLWPTLWALWLASGGFPDKKILVVFLFGVFFMRSAGCILNDIVDKDFDKFVSRTKNRPLASNKLSSIEAFIFASGLIIVSFLLVLTTNALTVQLSCVAVILAGIYPFLKRYTYLPQIFLGLVFGWSIPMSFAATTNSIPQIAWLLLIANILWVVVYDTIYAMIDREDDLKIGIKSTAILFDDADRFIIGIIQVLVLVALIIVGKQASLNIIYYFSIIFGGCLFLYQSYLIKDREPKKCMQAFLNNNWFGLVLFIGLFINYL
ncbi:MAG: 4-hydroxybenzoate octaprenyltransferase [Pseudomonadota bacterium]|nr:4-hydroxybenzoate octaprenyltransferase [Pseudomonadota bacterium]|tara:strand:+ start:324 stop:1199 length:876 start_codon:yes stop_codon:yes gene_type:complete